MIPDSDVQFMVINSFTKMLYPLPDTGHENLQFFLLELYQETQIVICLQDVPDDFNQFFLCHIHMNNLF
jgi:hypothetical protein